MNNRSHWIWIFIYCLAIAQIRAARSVTISTAATSGGSFVSGVFTPTADNAVASASAITSLLNGGTPVTITTGSTGTQAGDIVFSSSITASSSSTSSLTLNAQGSVILAPIDLGTSGANLTVTASGQITEGGPMHVSGSASFSTGASAITLTDGNNAFSGTVSFSGGGGHLVFIVNNRPLVLGTSTAGKDIIVNAVGAITQTGPLTISGNASFAAGANPITLDDANNNFTGTVGFNNSGANDVILANNRALILSASIIGSNFTATAAGAITEAGALNVAGASAFSAGAHAITLTQTNQFTGSVSLDNSGANNVSLTNTLALVLGTSTVGKNLVISAAGAITQTGVLTVGGTAALSAGANPITLDNSNNLFTGVIGLTNSGVNNAVIVNSQSVVMGASTIGRNLTINANGALTQTGALTVTGTSSFSVVSNINLTLTNQLTGAVSLSNATSADITFMNNRALVLGPSAINGNVAITAAGSINQNGIMTVSGTSSFSADTNSIALSKSNQFSGVMTFNNSNAGDVFLTTTLPLVLGPSTIGRNLTANTLGPITQTGPLSVGGTSFFLPGSNTVTLDNISNAFTGTVAFLNHGAFDVVITNNLPLLLTTSTIGGNFIANAAGAITEAGPLTVTGTSTFSAGAHAMTLTQANQLTGIVILNNSGANNVSLSNSRALVLGPSSIGQNLTLNVSGAITQTDVLSVNGNASFFAGGNPITLTQSNLISGTVVLNNSAANDVSFVDASPVSMSTCTVGGNFTITSPAILLKSTLKATGNLTLAGPATIGVGSVLLQGLSVNFQGSITGNGKNLTVAGPATLAGGTLDAADSHFTFQDSFTIGSDLLYIQNWNGAVPGGGASQIFAGSSASGLPDDQLLKVLFVNPAGFPPGLTGAAILSTGEIVPASRLVLQFSQIGNDLVLTWTAPAVLQSATNAAGPYLDVPLASSPYTNTLGDPPSQFFRLR